MNHVLSNGSNLPEVVENMLEFKISNVGFCNEMSSAVSASH